MFATTLREAREAAHLSIAELADRAATSRAAVTEYEQGKKLPRIDTAERLLSAAGDEFVALTKNAKHPSRIVPGALSALESWSPDRANAISVARRDLAVIVDADATVERLDLSWGQVKTLVGGTTVEGDELSVWRLHELHRSARVALRQVERGQEPTMRAIASDRLFTLDLSLVSVPRRAMDFLVRATEAGADPAYIRHLVGAYLAHHGYPWVWPPHRLAADYRRALVACRRHGDGSAMVEVLSASISGHPRGA